MNIKKFYNKYHNKNKHIQLKVIKDKNYTYQYLLEAINKYFKKAGYVLDVGCGVGTIDFYLSKNHKLIEGYDISSKAINLGKKSIEFLGIDNVKLFSANVESKNLLKKNYFDYCICSEVIEHVYDDTGLVRTIHNSLKPDGIAIFSTPSINAPLYRLGLLNQFDQDVGHLRRYSADDLESLFKNNKFEIVEITRTEGIFRNALYTSSSLGNLVKFIRGPLIHIVNFIDNLTLKVFGESNYYIVVKK